MRTGRLISEHDLAEFLRVHAQTLYHWRQAGRITDDVQEGGGERKRHFYTHATVDQFLCSRAVSKRQRIYTLAELLAYEHKAGKASLLTIAEACERLELSHHTVGHHIRLGSLAAFRLSDDPEQPDDTWHPLRIPAPGLAHFIARSSTRHAVRAVIVAKILGVERALVSQLVQSGRLKEVKIARKLDETFVTRPSLLALLTELLDGGDAEAWITLRRAHGYEPMLTKQRAIAEYHTSHRRLTRALSDGELWCIKTPGGGKVQQVRIPAQSLHEWAMERIPLTANALAHHFGCTLEDAADWTIAGIWCKARHGARRTETCPRRSCITAYINGHRNRDDFSGEDWLAWCEQDKIQVFSGPQATTYTKGLVGPVDLQEAYHAGTIRGVLLPRGDIALPLPDLLRVMRHVRRQQHLIFGGDYHVATA